MREIALCTLLELRGLYGINRHLHTKDKKARRNYRLLVLASLLLVLLGFAYIAGMVFGLHALGVGEYAPACLALLASLILLIFGLLKAGDRVFGNRGVDILSSLPIRTESIVIGRLISLYIEDLLLTLLVMLPGMATYAALAGLSTSSLLITIVGTLAIPLLPLSVSTALGTVIKGLSAGVKHKSVLQTVLVMIPLLALLTASILIDSGVMPVELDGEAIQLWAMGAIRRTVALYPPSMWLQAAVLGSAPWPLCGFLALSFAATGVTVYVVAKFFRQIVRRLSVSGSRSTYKMEALSGKSLLRTLLAREQKRYFASSIYVTNTLVGPIIGVLFAVVILVLGFERVQESIPFDIRTVLPIVITTIFCIMPTSCTAISMEGKQVWLVKSLPVPTKAWLDSKILLNLLLYVPFFLVAQVCICIAVHCFTLAFILSFLLSSALLVFSVVLGIGVNIKLHRFDWEKEEAIVKQSASSAIGGFGGMLLCLPVIGAALVIPEEYRALALAGLLLCISASTVLLYRSNNRVNLQKL